MNSPSERYVIATLKSSHRNQILDLLGKTFETFPLTIASGKKNNKYICTREDWKNYWSFYYIDEISTNNLCFGAFDPSKNNKLIGVFLNGDITFQIPKNIDSSQTNLPFLPFRKLEDLMNQKCRELKPKLFIKGLTAECWGLSVDEDYQNKKVSTFLTNSCSQYLIWKGYKYLTSERTNTIGYKATSRFNFIPIVEINVKEFQFEGEKVFEKIDDSQKIVMYQYICLSPASSL